MKNNFLYFFLIFCMLGARLSVAQDTLVKCATMQMEEQNNIKYPEWKANRLLLEKKIQEHIRVQKLKQFRTTSSGPAIYTIPVVVHILHNVANGEIIGKNIPSQQVYDQIAVLNEDYRRLNSDTSNSPAIYKPVAADIQIEFCLAVRDPNGDPTNGINRVYNPQSSYSAYVDDVAIKSQSYWPSDQYLNIWVCDLASGVLGYAQFPSNASDDQGPAETDGVVIDYSTFGKNVPTSTKYNLGRTSTHEIGHWLNLYHIWGDQSDCSGDDFCADIPPCSDTYFSSKPTCNMPLQCGNPRMIQNYMDYSDDACMNMFTADQKARMQAVMTTSPRRIAIQNSLGCCNTCYVAHADFKASKTNNVHVAETITFTSLSTGNITSYDWDFGSGAVPATATGIGPHTVQYFTDGPKTVSLTTHSNYGTGSDNQTKTDYIHVIYTAPAVDFYASKTSAVALNEFITFTDASTGYITSYDWNFGLDAAPASATGIGPHTVSYSTPGLKTVTLAASSSYGTDSRTKTQYISVLPANLSELHIYPNPAKDKFSIAMSFTNPTKVHVLIYDYLGRNIFEEENENITVYNDIIDVKAWANGLYIINVITGDNNVVTSRMLVIK